MNMNKKNTHLYCAGFALMLALAFTGCTPLTDTPAIEPDQPVVEETSVTEVKYVPVFNTCALTASLSSRSVSYTTPVAGSNPSDPKNVLYQIPLLAPVILSITENTKNYKVGDSFESVILGNTVITTISEDGNNNVVYIGKWPDGKSYYKLVVSAEGKGSFEQHLDIASEANAVSVHTYIVSESSDVIIGENGTFNCENGTSRGLVAVTSGETKTLSSHYYEFKIGTSKTSNVSYVFQATKHECWSNLALNLSNDDFDISSNRMLTAISTIVPDENVNSYTDDGFIRLVYCLGGIWNMVGSDDEVIVGGEAKSGKDLVTAIWAAL